MTAGLIKENVKTLLQDRKITCRSIAINMGEKERNVSNQINGDTVMSWEVFLGAIKFLPDISMEWLIRGIGEKYLATYKQPISNASPVGYINSPGAHHNNNTVIGSPGAFAEGGSAELTNKIEKLQADIEERDAKITALQQERDNIMSKRDARIHELEAELSQVRSENSKLVEANYKLIMGK